ncbi:MAG: FliH/SctL family protein [Candidatus Zixiibacteriota bacterium]
MSKILRYIKEAPRVPIGEKRLDLERQATAEQKLASVDPEIEIITGADGSKLIPLIEILKIFQIFEEQTQKAYQKGYDEGHRAGLNQGRSEGRAQTEEVLQQFDQAIKDAVVQRESLLQEAKLKVLDLVMQISRKVTFDAVTVDPEATLAIIGGVIDTLTDRSKLKIRINPDHLPVVQQNVEQYLKEPSILKQITLEADPRVRYGGCLIETPSGDIDARVESQLDVVEEVLCAGEENH